MKKLKQILIEIHNALGSLMSLMFVFWCVSGIVLIFDGFPHASRQERFAFLVPITAQDTLGLQAPAPNFKGQLSFEIAYGQPIYRLKTGRKKEAVYDARTLEQIDSFSQEQAVLTAQSFLGAEVEQVTQLQALDAWMPWSYYKPLLPIYKCKMADDKHSYLYVSAKTGNIIQQTDRHSRWMARLGAMPHWVYFKRLKMQENKWKRVIILLSSMGILISLTGLFAGVIRLNHRRKKGLTPYKKSWYRWHHLSGFFFGTFLFTFLLSGLVSVTSVPNGLVGVDETRKSHLQWNQSLDLENWPPISPAKIFNALENKKNIRQIKWVKSVDELQFHIYRENDHEAEVYFYHNGDIIKRPRLSAEEVRTYLPSVLGDLPYAMHKQLTYDHYYSASAMLSLPLPVYKIEVEDEESTWLYINPADGRQVYKHTIQSRYRRWLYRFLHTFDIPVLKRFDAWRKGGLVFLCLGALVVSVSGLVLSFKYYRRQYKKIQKRLRIRS